MERPIMKDVLFLQQPSEPATEADKSLILDLQDTLNAHRNHCVGMAANMIGVKKRMIVVAMGFMPVVGNPASQPGHPCPGKTCSPEFPPTSCLMINPEILSKSGEYEAEEGCLSLEGTRKTTRYKDIEVKYQDPSFKWQKQKFSGQIAHDHNAKRQRRFTL